MGCARVTLVFISVGMIITLKLSKCMFVIQVKTVSIKKKGVLNNYDDDE